MGGNDVYCNFTTRLFCPQSQLFCIQQLFYPLAILLAGSIIIQSGFTPAALAHLADITEEYTHDRGAIMGMYSVFLGIGQFIGATVGGPFVDWRGADGIVVVTALFGLVSLFTLLRLHATEARQTVAA